MPVDPTTAAWILEEVNSLVDGPGVGFVKIRVGGRRVKRIFNNASKAPPVTRATDVAWPCPRDNQPLAPEGAGESRRYRCAACGYRWTREQLHTLAAATSQNGSVRAGAAT